VIERITESKTAFQCAQNPTSTAKHEPAPVPVEVRIDTISPHLVGDLRAGHTPNRASERRHEIGAPRSYGRNRQESSIAYMISTTVHKHGSAASGRRRLVLLRGSMSNKACTHEAGRLTNIVISCSYVGWPGPGCAGGGGAPP
jgi:hypothetical protein